MATVGRSARGSDRVWVTLGAGTMAAYAVGPHLLRPKGNLARIDFLRGARRTWTDQRRPVLFDLKLPYR